jgi:hypothetical protein
MDGKEIRAKNDEINSGNCNVGSYKHTKVEKGKTKLD